ncbi:SusC/RagA family TonB-linked outer membrane protein [Belliella marina]|uniref:SusC/RagA family TonB-linked outer membrane protein n=1 Tax=Belliella marina TaxID=1644146 RepID=A0ABW4VID9_9BACT
MKKILYYSKMIGRYYLYGFLLQVCCIPILLAANLTAQSKSLKQVFVNIEVENASLPQVFSILNEKTEFSFVYDSKSVNNLTPVSLKSNGESLEDVLLKLSASHQLSFQQVNERISVKSLQPNKQNPIEVNVTITGKVYDNEGVPLPGATVRVEGTNNGVATGLDGEFSIVAPENATLVVSYIGFITSKLKVLPNQTIYEIKLEVDDSALEEVVVIGYGEQKRANVLGAVETIMAEDIEDLPMANLGSALINRVPGVGVSQASGRPGANTSINIRNAAVFSASSSTEPLYVIDGFQMSKEDFDNLDATMVESITFLKDAAASIYGSRGANGVVLVTTKKGKPGKIKINYSGTHGISTATQMPQMLSGYDHAMLLNGLNLSNNSPENSLYTESELEYLRNTNNSWLDGLWGNAHLSRHTVNLSGGSDKVTYFAGANYYKETGNLQDLYVNKFGFRFGMNAEIVKGLNATVSLATDNSLVNRPQPKGITANAETMSETFSSLLLTPAWVPPYIDGKPVFSSTPGWHPQELPGSGSYNRSKSNGITVNASLEYKPQKIEGLTFRVQYGQNVRNNFGKEYYASYNLYEFIREGNHPTSGAGQTENVIFTNQINAIREIRNGNQIYLSHNNSMNYQLNESVSYTRSFGEHYLSVMVAAEQSETYGDNFFTRRDNQSVPGVDQIFAFSLDRNNWDNGGSGNENARMSYFGRLNYSFKDRYLLESSFRADASPNFPPGSDWGYFPSVAVGWKLSEENFFRDNVSFINNLKLRFQVGFTGNDQVAAFQWRTRYTQTTGMLFGNAMTNGLDNARTPNSQITWEKALYKNLGLDGTIFNHRLNFGFDFYDRLNYDMFNAPTATVPTTFGGVISDQNYGRLKSWGLEVNLGYNGKIGRDVYYNIGIITGRSDNRVLRRYISDRDAGTWRDTNGRRTDNGIEGYKSIGLVTSQEQLDAFLEQNPGYTIDGQIPRVGWMLFEDIDGDGRITSEDRTRIVNRQGGGFGMGHNMGLSYKGVKLSVNWSWSVGGYRVYDNNARQIPTHNRSALAIWNDSWSVLNPEGTMPALDARFASQVYDLWITSATMMRINNMNLSYSLPESLARRFGVPQFRVFATGTNLWDIVNKQDYKYSRTNNSFDYPAMRTFSFGLNFSL